MHNAPSLPGFTEPMKPWDYVRLRRAAAGLSIADAAKPFWTHPDHRLNVEQIMASIERPGVRMQPHVAATLQRAFPFDADIYRQLCDAPPSHHPRLCLHCGWDAWTQAIDLQGNDVTWHAEDVDVCTRCTQLAERKALRRAA